MDFSATCRTCIKTFNNIDLNPIFLTEETHKRFSNAFFSCTGVQIKFNDGLPQNMCTACMNQFNNTLKFRKQCKQAEMHLLKIKTQLESENVTLVTNDKLSIQITEEENLVKKQLTVINKSDLQNFSNVMKSHSEYKNFNIKNEPVIDIDKEDEQPLKYLVSKNIERVSLLKSHDLKQNNESNDIDENSFDTDYFNYETILYNNENNFNTDKTLPQNNNDTRQKTVETLSDTISQHVSNSDSNITEEKTVEIPYIITDINTKKTMRVVCKLCQKELSIRSIDSHMMRRHPGADERKVKCELCDKYVLREKLNRHRVMMHGSVGVKCGYCKSEFSSKEELMDHVTTCAAKNRKRKVNDSGRALAECDICKMSMQRASLNKHKAVKHAGLRPVCEHCGKSFGNKFRLHEHYRAKHGYEKFQCRYCDFKSAGIMAMRNHERRHRGEKPFVCEACGAKFHAAYLLMQHKHSHNTEKLVKCDLCPASFKANNNLHMHKLTCHSKSYYSCTLCGRSYKCRYYAVKHVRLAHNVSEAPEVIKLMAP